MAERIQDTDSGPLPHPQRAQIAAGMERVKAALSYVTAAHEVRTAADDRAIGPGWEWLVHIQGPDDTPYAARVFSVHLRFPIEFPSVPPRVRFAGLIVHGLLDEVGRPIPLFYLPPNLSWGEDSSVSDVLATAEGMLHKPLSPPSEDGAAIQSAMEMGNAPEDVKVQAMALCGEERVATAQRARSFLAHQLSHLFTSRAETMYACTLATLEYSPLHPRLFSAQGWAESAFQPDFAAAAKTGDAAAVRSLVREVTPGVFSFPLLRPEFCHMLRAEVEALEESDAVKVRPNSMNQYGVVLNLVGFTPALDRLVSEWLRPLARVLFPGHGGASLDEHHSFVVEYEEGADVSLDAHVDDSEVTTNVCIEDGFTGAGLAFCGMHNTAGTLRLAARYSHALGHAVMHPGLRRHAALPIESGRRRNLVVWARSSDLREDPAFRSRFQRDPGLETGDPDPVCVSVTHDSDAATWRE